MKTSNSIQEIEIKSWEHLMEFFDKDFHREENINRDRCNWVYRGVANKDWELETSLQRTNPLSTKSVELHLLRNFKKYSPPDTVLDDSIWTWLAIGQHHGLPTRFLDWSFSMLYALHFALDDHNSFNNGSDAAIWCVDLVDVKQKLPKKVKKEYDAVGAYTLTLETLKKLWPTLEQFDIDNDKDFIFFFEPPSITQRIINQYALVSCTNRPQIITSKWLITNKLTKRYIIPNNLKWKFRDQLDQLNITERTIYPGLDGLCQLLKRYYFQSPAKKI